MALMLATARREGMDIGEMSMMGEMGMGEMGMGMSYEQLSQLEDVVVRTPEEEIEALPESTFSLGEAKGKGKCKGEEDATATGASSSSDSRCCSVCKEDYQEGERLKQLPCKHTFHKECVVQWLRRSRKCPICSASVGEGERVRLPPAAGAGAAGAAGAAAPSSPQQSRERGAGSEG